MNIMNIRKQIGSIDQISKAEFHSPVHHLQVFNPLFSQVLADVIADDDEWDENATLQTCLEFESMTRVKKTDFPHTIYEQPVYIKFAPLLDPLKYLTGKYDLEPEYKKHKMLTWAAFQAAKQKQGPETKYQDINNASYIDAFFCFLNSQLLHQHQFIHAIDFYGSYLGVQEKFRINIIEDYDYLQKFDEFHKKKLKGEIVIEDAPTDSDSDSSGSSNNSTPRERESRQTRNRGNKKTLKWTADEVALDELDILAISPNHYSKDYTGVVASSGGEGEGEGKGGMTLEYDATEHDDSVLENDSSLEENTEDSSDFSESEGDFSQLDFEAVANADAQDEEEED